MKKQLLFGLLLLIAILFCVKSEQVYAQSATLKVTEIVASNKGTDYDLENDDFRDRLIQLFSYSSYYQLNEFLLQLEEGKPEHFEVAGGYELTLSLFERDDKKLRLSAILVKEGKQFLNTEVSIPVSAPVFLGGPPAEGGNLIIVIEAGY